MAKGDYIIRGDQPYRTLIDMYTSVQNYPTANPRPYDDTGWTMQYMRNVQLKTITDKAILDQAMTMLNCRRAKRRAAWRDRARRSWWSTPATTTS